MNIAANSVVGLLICLLAIAAARLSHRVQSGGLRLALPALHGEGLPQAADGLRQGGGAALLQGGEGEAGEGR